MWFQTICQYVFLLYIYIYIHMIKAHQQQYTHAQILKYFKIENYCWIFKIKKKHWSHRFKVDVRSSQNHLYLEALKKHGKWSSSIWGAGRGKKRCAFHPFIATHLKNSKSKRKFFDIIILRLFVMLLPHISVWIEKLFQDLNPMN